METWAGFRLSKDSLLCAALSNTDSCPIKAMKKVEGTEDTLTVRGWQNLFEEAGLIVTAGEEKLWLEKAAERELERVFS